LTITDDIPSFAYRAHRQGNGPDDGNEVVTVRATARVDVTGWMLEDVANHRFHLPPLTLMAGETVRVPNIGRPVWNNDGDTSFLYDAAARLVDSLSYSGSGSTACR
jgi:hypothetical protein